MNAQRLDWVNGIGYDDALEASQGGKRVLHVGDGLIGSMALLSAGMPAQEALHDYAEGYDAGDLPADIKVHWQLFEDGENTDGGFWTFGVNYD